MLLQIDLIYKTTAAKPWADYINVTAAIYWTDEGVAPTSLNGRNLSLGQQQQ